MKQACDVVVPRANPSGAAKQVIGTFLVGIALKDPSCVTFDEELKGTLLEVLGEENNAPDIYEKVKQEYLTLWESHEPLPLHRYLHVREKRQTRDLMKGSALKEIGSGKIICGGCMCPSHMYIEDKNRQGRLHLEISHEGDNGDGIEEI